MLVVKFEDVTKLHRRTLAVPSNIRDDILMIGRRRASPKVAPRPALDSVSFGIEQGTAVALVGANGAGKSTALRLMSRIVYPTSGKVRVRGRVGALLEVGSGVHPELSGRENVWLYGSIIGIPRAEIRKRFDDIVEFSELSASIDKQAKFYSSGMQLRLGFAIATFLEPETLLVDESLATADLNFQLKCVDRLSTLVRNGTTLLFVSHELAAVEALCRRALLLERGSLVHDGDTRGTLAEYRRRLEDARVRSDVSDSSRGDQVIRVVHAACVDDTGEPATSVPTGGSVTVSVTVECTSADVEPMLELTVTDGRSGDLFACNTVDDGVDAPAGSGLHVFTCRLAGLPLRPRSYRVWAGVRDRRRSTTETAWSEVAAFRVDNGTDDVSGGDTRAPGISGGPVQVDHQWLIADP